MKMIDVSKLTDDEIELCKMLIEKNKADCIGRSCSNCFLGYIDGSCIDLAKKILIEIEKNKSVIPQHVEYPDVKDYNPISVNNNCISTEQYNCYDRTIKHDQDKCKNIAKKILKEIEKNKSDEPQHVEYPDLKDMIKHPAHYTFGKIEVWDAIADWKLDYFCGCAIKYITRAGRKDPNKEIEDLKKAVNYLNKKIELLEKEK